MKIEQFLSQKICLTCICLFAGAPFFAQSQESPTSSFTVAAETGDGGAVAATYDLSVSEELTRRDRDPFWPFDYKKNRGNVTNRTDATNANITLPPSINDWDEAQKKLKIDGFVQHCANRFAIVNGAMCQQGYVLGVRHDDYIYRFRVKTVGETSVSFEKLNRKPVGGVEKKTSEDKHEQ